jgi:ABC-2 type transport system permease protein
VLKYFLQKEFRQVFRQREMVMIIFLMPVIQLLILGYAINLDVKHVRLAIFDQDQSVLSRSIVSKFFASSYFQSVKSAREEGATLLEKGQADVVLKIPPHFTRDIRSGKSTELELIADAQNSNIAGIGVGYTQGVLGRFLADESERRLDRQPALRKSVHQVGLRAQAYYNPELLSVYYMVPGIVVILLMVTTTLLTALGIVREKEIGTLEQLMVTPLRKFHFIVGKTAPFVVIAFVEMSVALLVGTLWFGIPFRGSLWLLTGTAALFILTTLGVGLFISTVSGTQQQALFFAWFFMVFGMLMSGFFTPIENMPRAVQLLTYLNPLRYFMTIIRAIFLKSSGLQDLAGEIFALALFGTLIFSLALLRFRKRIG